jgi:hypothetical protein
LERGISKNLDADDVGSEVDGRLLFVFDAGAFAFVLVVVFVARRYLPTIGRGGELDPPKKPPVPPIPAPPPPKTSR